MSDERIRGAAVTPESWGQHAHRLREGTTQGPWTVDEQRPRWITTAGPIQVDEADWGQPYDCRTYKLVTLDDDRAWSYADTRIAAAAPLLAERVEVLEGVADKLRAGWSAYHDLLTPEWRYYLPQPVGLVSSQPMSPAEVEFFASLDAVEDEG